MRLRRMWQVNVSTMAMVDAVGARAEFPLWTKCSFFQLLPFLLPYICKIYDSACCSCFACQAPALGSVPLLPEPPSKET